MTAGSDQRKVKRRQASRVAAVLTGASVLALAVGWARRDHRQWLLLGKGGLPSTFKGWLRVTQMRLRARDPLRVDHLRSLHDHLHKEAAPLLLAIRQTERPRVGRHPVPHRQLNQHIAPALTAALQQVFDEEVRAHAESVEYALSFFERHTLAVTCRTPADQSFIDGADAEIAHIHPHDGSMHMVLSPRDTVAAVLAGWAELHGLAGKVMKLPATYAMVYAPQEPADLITIRLLLQRAIAYRTLSVMPGLAHQLGGGSQETRSLA